MVDEEHAGVVAEGVGYVDSFCCVCFSLVKVDQGREGGTYCFGRQMVRTRLT